MQYHFKYNKFNNFKSFKKKINEEIKMLFTFPGLGGLFAGIWLFVIIFAVVWFVVAILIAVWVYKDAKKRDMNAAMWLLIVLLTGCIGCIIYLVVRD